VADLRIFKIFDSDKSNSLEVSEFTEMLISNYIVLSKKYLGSTMQESCQGFVE
jgi:hypothetical protein